MLDNKDVLVIADGAAFGALIENCVDYFETQFNREYLFGFRNLLNI